MTRRPLLGAETVHRPAPANIVSGDDGLFTHEHTREIAPTALLGLQDAELLPNGFLIRKGRRVQETVVDALRGRRALIAAARVGQYRLLAQRTTVGRALLVTDEFSNGFFHWIGDVLPRLEVVPPEELAARTLAVPAMADYSYSRETLVPYGLESIRYLAWNERLFCSDLAVVTQVAPTGNYRPSVMARLRRRMRAFFGAVDGGRRLYVSRAHAGRRRVANEAELLPILKRFGFERVSIERLSFAEQVRLAGSASILLGNHGAGLTHACWLPPGAVLFELRRTGDRENNCYYSLAGALGLKYHYLNCRAENDRKATHDADIVVDVPRLETELAVAIKGLRA